MIGKNKYPDFIWDVDSGHLTIERTGDKFVDSSEYIEDKYKKFSNIDEIRSYLNENKITGSVGRKLK